MMSGSGALLQAAQQDGTTSNLKSLPIACTLTPGGLRERLGLIHALTAEALVGYDRDGLVLTRRYAPAAVERVRAMVASEQHCCAFLTFDVQEHPIVHVKITAPHPRESASQQESDHSGDGSCMLCRGSIVSVSVPVLTPCGRLSTRAGRPPLKSHVDAFSYPPDHPPRA